MTTDEQGAAAHERQTHQGVTFAWAASLVAMFAVVSVFALSEVGGAIVVGEVDLLAAGAINAIGLVSVGGINSIGVVSLGMLNAVGVIAVGGVNAVGLVAIGGYNSLGLVTIGGVNSTPLGGSLFRATIYAWRPRIYGREG